MENTINSMFMVENNTTALQSYIDSMQCAIDKAKSGSTVEDGYFVEKLGNMANRLGFDLIERK